VPGPDDQDPPVAPRRRGFRGVARAFAREGAAATVALATGLAALVFTLFPGLKPFTPTNLRAEVHVDAIERAVTRDQWRWRIAQGDRRRYDALLAQDRELAAFKDSCGGGTDAGFIAYVRTEAEGYKRRALKLRAALYDAKSKRRVEGVQEVHSILATLPIDAPTAMSVQRVWLFEPRAAKRYYVRAEIYDQHDNLLGFADGKAFAPLSDDEVRALPGECRTDAG
jgi:hypothetical protein